jgi:anaerobic selenocysteine-containing dehydrogenase
VPLRPGTDAALALSMLNVVMNEDLVDKPFVREWCYGYEQLKDTYSKLSACVGRTDYLACRPRKYMRDGTSVCNDEGGRYRFRQRCGACSFGQRCDPRVAILMAVTGHLDRPGCNLLAPSPAESAMPVPNGIKLYERYTAAMVEKLVGPEFPVPFQPFLEGTTSAYYRIMESVLTETPLSDSNRYFAGNAAGRQHPGIQASRRSPEESRFLCCDRCGQDGGYAVCGPCPAHRYALRNGPSV